MNTVLSSELQKDDPVKLESQVLAAYREILDGGVVGRNLSTAERDGYMAKVGARLAALKENPDPLTALAQEVSCLDLILTLKPDEAALLEAANFPHLGFAEGDPGAELLDGIDFADSGEFPVVGAENPIVALTEDSGDSALGREPFEGSGSGLLDLTRDSDDTALGAELLEGIDMGDDGHDARPACPVIKRHESWLTRLGRLFAGV